MIGAGVFSSPCAQEILVFSFLRQITILIGGWLISTTTEYGSKTGPIFRITQKELALRQR